MMVLDPYAHAMDGTSANAAATAPVADAGNTCDGTMSVVWTAAGATLTEDWTVAFDGAEWTVTGSVTGLLTEKLEAADGFYPDVDTHDIAAKVSFVIASGGTPFANGDSFTFTTTASEILVMADEQPISEVDATQSVAPRAEFLDSGELFIGWREGNSGSANGKFGFRLDDHTKALTTIQYWYDTGANGEFGDYGSGTHKFASDSDNMFIVFSMEYDDGTDDY